MHYKYTSRDGEVPVLGEEVVDPTCAMIVKVFSSTAKNLFRSRTVGMALELEKLPAGKYRPCDPLEAKSWVTTRVDKAQVLGHVNFEVFDTLRPFFDGRKDDFLVKTAVIQQGSSLQFDADEATATGSRFAGFGRVDTKVDTQKVQADSELLRQRLLELQAAQAQDQLELESTKETYQKKIDRLKKTQSKQPVQVKLTNEVLEQIKLAASAGAMKGSQESDQDDPKPKKGKKRGKEERKSSKKKDKSEDKESGSGKKK